MSSGKNAHFLIASALILAVVAVTLVGSGAMALPSQGVVVTGPQSLLPSTPMPALPSETAAQASETEPAASSAPATPSNLAGPTALPTEPSTPSGEGTAASQPELASPTAPPGSVSATPADIAQPDQGTVIGYSVLGRPLVAYRVGTGPVKVALIGDIHGAYESNTHLLVQELVDHFLAHPDEVPGRVSLWLIPTANPDGLAAGTRWNAHNVDLNRNADTDLDGCAGNDWSPDTSGSEGSHPGAGGPYPFSEPEALALRDFLADAQAAVFYHSAAGAIYVDTCQRHLPSARLAQALSEGTGYPVPEEGWTGYRITGDLGDYLAGEGIATATVELTYHKTIELDRNLEGVRSLLAEVDSVVAADAESAGAPLAWLDGACLLRLPAGSLVHPLSLEVVGDTIYLLDSGRVLALNFSSGGVESACTSAGGALPAFDVLLAPGDSVDGVRVTEPLDLVTDAASASSGAGRGALPAASLFVLDRAGDVYRYDPTTAVWALERYGRRAIDTGDHYYVALSAWATDRFLLETSREKVWRFTQGEAGAAWADVPRGRDVDLSVSQGSLYVLTRALNTPVGDLIRYQRAEGRAASARPSASFEPEITLSKPRQVAATAAGVFVLDRAGRRLLELSPASGELRQEYRFADRRAVSSFWANPGANEAEAGPYLVLAGRDVLYLYGGVIGAGQEAAASGADGHDLPQALPNDPAWLEGLRGLAMPIDGAGITRREYQMPGSPRHYRMGVHEGIDFYTGTSGVTIDNHTPVRAVAAGKVVRAMLDYKPLTASQARAWASQVTAAGYTPPEVLDEYRGRQIWIEHENGLVSRYAHLSAIAPGIVVGASVEQGQVIGTVGNSGTPESVSNAKGELHLHLELWAGEHYVGQFLRPIEAREWIEGILR